MPDKPPMAEVDFSRNPFLVFWEVTRACAYVCRHCRARAQPRRHPQELTLEEGRSLLDQIADMGVPLVVLTGGDPLMRPDLFHFIEHGVKRRLRVSLAPSVTHLLTRKALEQAQEAGLARLSISLDGTSPQSHDAFRGMPGSFLRTMEVLEQVREIGLPVQINTTVSRFNLGELEELSKLVTSFNPVLWDLFFLVPTGRGRREDMISPQEHERLFLWLYHFSQQAPFDIKTTAAQHYRRVVLQQGGNSTPGFSRDSVGRARGVNDGNGCCFVSHIGEVYPSGFLPLVAGSISHQPLAQVYRDSPLFQELRDPTRLKGKCGRCDYNRVCGGSRSRAYAVTGDPLEAEPYCVYEPA